MCAPQDGRTRGGVRVDVLEGKDGMLQGQVDGLELSHEHGRSVKLLRVSCGSRTRGGP